MVQGLGLAVMVAVQGLGWQVMLVLQGLAWATNEELAWGAAQRGRWQGVQKKDDRGGRARWWLVVIHQRALGR